MRCCLKLFDYSGGVTLLLLFGLANRVLPLASLFEQLLNQASLVFSLRCLLFLLSLHYQDASLIVLDKQVHSIFVIGAVTIATIFLNDIGHDSVLDESCTLTKPD